MPVVRVYHEFDELPEYYEALWSGAEGAGFFSSRLWMELLRATTLDSGERLLACGIESDQQPRRALALVPLRTPAGQPGSRLWGMRPSRCSYASFTNWYSCSYTPLVATEVTDPCPLFRLLFRTLQAAPYHAAILELNYLDTASTGHQALRDALRALHYRIIPYFQANTWYEPVVGWASDDYIATRPKSIRSEYQRKDRKLRREHRVETRIWHQPDHAGEATGVFLDVYTQSWKQAERHPRFIPELIRRGMDAGSVRVCALYIDGVASAVQIYTWDGTTAVAFKDAYSPRFRKLSPASVLRLHTVRHFIDKEGAREINFGYGDEDYKQAWFSKKRELGGMMAFRLSTPAGLSALTGHLFRAAAAKAHRFQARLSSAAAARRQP